MTQRQPHKEGTVGHDFNTKNALVTFITTHSQVEADSIPTIGSKADEIIRNKFISLISERTFFQSYANQGYVINLSENPNVGSLDISTWAQITMDEANQFIDLAVKYGLGTESQRILTFTPQTVEAITGVKKVESAKAHNSFDLPPGVNGAPLPNSSFVSREALREVSPQLPAQLSA